VADEDLSDVLASVARLEPFADGIELNASCPNVSWGRDRDTESHLEELTRELAARTSRPVLVKLPPFATPRERDAVVALAGVAAGAGAAGLTCGNTRMVGDPRQAVGRGGLSGRPLFRLATRMLAETYVRVEGQFPLVGVGGIDSGAAAFAKIKAGATLLQLYTGLVFRGLKLVSAIKADLLSFLRLGRYDSLAAAVGLDAAAATAEPWPE
jgi:dihydroorotate dehydrogenase